MKAKFYPLRTLFFTLLLSFCFAETIKAQTLELGIGDATTGGDGTRTSFGNNLRYTFDITGDATMNDIMIGFPIPAGTTYVPGSTQMEGVPVADVNGTMPWVTPTLIPAPATGSIRIRFLVNVIANSGVIEANASLQRGTNPPVLSNQTQTVILTGNGCSNKIYALTTMYPAGILPPAPTLYWPYQFIRELDITTGNTGLIYDGKNGAGYDVVNNIDLPKNTVLTEATAMAMQGSSGRLYFVNQPVNNVPADLCYFTVGTTVANRITGHPLTQNTTSFITRMTMDANGQGYAITDNGQEFIRFTADASSVSVDNRGTLIDDLNNGNNSILAETGGDIVCDGAGNLLLIPNSGKVYRINTNTNVATYLSAIAGFPSDGCNSVAIDQDGYIYIGGHYTRAYKLTLSTLTLTPLASNNTFVSKDFAGCSLPVQQARVAVNETTTTPLSAEVSARVLPNPFRKELHLQVQLTTAETVKIRLVDFYGRTVYTTTRQLGAGTNSLSLAVPGNLSSGIYVVDVWAGNNHLLQKKLVKQ